jgi:GntR family transcriptional regulator
MTTRYDIVAQEIRKLIRVGHWQPGTRIPPEPQLCEQFHVSRTTLRQAVQILAGEGLLQCRQGLGTFVLNPETARRPFGLADFTEQVLQGQLKINREVIANLTVPANESLARILKIPPGSLIKDVQRLDRIDEERSCTDRCLIPMQYADKLTDPDFASPLFQLRWEKAQSLTIHHLDQSIHTERATPDDVKNIGVPSDTWMLVLNEIMFDYEGTIVGIIISRYRGDACKLTARVACRQLEREMNP